MSNSVTNASKFQDEQRENTLSKIKSAISYLRENHIALTKTNIANEAGIHRNTLNKPYVEEFFLANPELLASKNEPSGLAKEQYEMRIADLEEKLKQSVAYNKKLKEDNHRLSNQLKELETDYEKLLGAYQVETSEKYFHI